MTRLSLTSALILGWITASVSLASSASATGRAPAHQRTPEGVDADDWRAIRAAYDAGRHSAFAANEGYRARNPGQCWTMQFDRRGFTATPDAGEWTWGLELATYGWGDVELAAAQPRHVFADGGRVAREWSDALTEWYVNDARGLEHGYTVHARPTDATGAFSLSLAVRGGLQPLVAANGRDVRFVDRSGGTVLTYAGLTVFDADGCTLAANWTRLGGDLRLSVDDRDARYPITIDPVAQQAYLKASNTGAGDNFGYSVAVSGDTAVVGSYFEDSDATGVNGNQSNDSAVHSGAVYVFVRNGTTWSQQAYLKASNTEAGDLFGYSVSISGDTVVVGAMWEDSSATGVNGNQTNNSSDASGAVYVFVRNGTTWSQQAYLKASNTDAGDRFGYPVSISGDTIAIGAHRESSSATGVNGNTSDNSASASGAAYIFVRNGTTWSQQAYLKASNASSFDRFGVAVSVASDTVVVGAFEEDGNATGVNGNQSDNSASNSGAAYVFVRNGTTWSQQAYLKASNTGQGDQFGFSVGASADTIVVGANFEDSDATGANGDGSNDNAGNSGAAYVFVRTGTTWSLQAYLKASNTEGGAFFGDEFGFSVSVFGDKIAVGAYREDSNATGVNGNQNDNSASDSGAAYVFSRSGTVWSQQAYLKSSNSGSGDTFGYSVTVSGDTVLVGATGEGSSATGVNGNQGDNSASGSGATYVFEVSVDSETYCFGDGTLPTACPCALPNVVPSPPAAFGHGCANSLNLNGALLSYSGVSSPDTLTIAVDVAPLYQGFAFLVKGNATSGAGIAASDGIRCVDGQLIRFGSHNAGTNGNPIGQWIYPNAAQTTPISAATLQPAGQTAYYQLFYRNAGANFCNASTANWSNGLQVAWP